MTKEQATSASYRTEIHFRECKTIIGPRGGTKTHTIACRVNGRCQTWKTRPEEFRLPVKRGLYEYAEINERNAGDFHLASECVPTEVKS